MNIVPYFRKPGTDYSTICIVQGIIKSTFFWKEVLIKFKVNSILV